MIAIDHAALRSAAFARQAELVRQHAVQEHRVQQTRDILKMHADRQAVLKEHVEKLRQAAAFLHELVDAIAAKNIARTEDLVNNALAVIFPDHQIQFRLISEIKRNTVQYRAAIIEDGHEGTINSHGGGVVAVISVVLKILFNVLAKRYHMLCFDESLSFLSDRYIPNASSFIKELSDQFNMPILLVTHQPLFAQAADQNYEVSSTGPRTVTFTHKAREA